MTESGNDRAVTLYVTVRDKEEGGRIGRALVEAKLAACANIIDDMTSVFSWEGEIQSSSESLLFAKTRSDLIDDATQLVIKEHSYDCPCVVALPITGGNLEFIDWIRAETRKPE